MDTVERRAILEGVILHYIRQGYRVIVETDNTAQLVKPKRFSLSLAIIGLFIYVVPFVIYLLYYLGQKDETVYVHVGAQGKVSLTYETGRTQVVNDVEQISSLSSLTVPVENEPGDTKNTEIALSVLALILVIVITAIVIFTIAH
ncbi:MAG: hypothetical protein JXA21_03465 [Anaerolineae bacterium]|nr:hypothetical protein [Anaerolineae bacterium]